ncbi:ABC transporter ATP-binding protein [Aquihabitans sp. McL0605]|uniref:ABC transporter ATP-binding protein n=1 Tax=Aquihabitans sp. McL0605 TaxID=3415671 RepID=UPI003CEB528A
MSDAALAIDAREVRKTYDHGRVVVLEDVTLQVAVGEYVALTGRSGGGKSTLLNLLGALDRPDSGSLQVAGQDLMKPEHPNRFRREQVGMVFQMHNLLPHLDALGNVGVAMMGSNLSRRDQRARAAELLRLVDLADLGHRRPPQMSGGERQRVALARAIANNPQVLIADEPTGSLDAESRELVLRLMERLRAEEGITVVVVTHDEAVSATADRTLHLRDGRIVAP